MTAKSKARNVMVNRWLMTATVVKVAVTITSAKSVDTSAALSGPIKKVYLVTTPTPELQAEIDSSAQLIPLSLIRIPDERQRDKAEPDDTLINSIQQRGLLHPIIVRNTPQGYVLVAGERRLRAHMKIEAVLIRATVLNDLSPSAVQGIELVENLARKQLSWQEEARAILGYHTTREAEFPTWTQLGTANDLGFSQSNISRILLVAKALANDSDGRIAKALTFSAAFNMLASDAERARIAAESRGIDLGQALASSLPPPIAPGATKEEKTAALLQHKNLLNIMDDVVEDVDRKAALIEATSDIKLQIAASEAETSAPSGLASKYNDSILQADFAEFIKSYDGPKFDVAHVDFPYGKDFSGWHGSTAGRGENAASTPVYDDSAETYVRLVEAFLTHQDRFLYDAAHVIFWYDMSWHQWTIDQFTAAGWTLVQPYPLTWSKGNSGYAPDPQRRPRHVYETALFFSRGDRKIFKIAPDHVALPPPPDKLHISQKPVPVLKEFLSMVVGEYAAVIDPTCGSGSALIAASQLGCRRFLGLELDPANVEIAQHLLNRHNVQPSEGTSDDES